VDHEFYVMQGERYTPSALGEAVQLIREVAMRTVALEAMEARTPGANIGFAESDE